MLPYEFGTWQRAESCVYSRANPALFEVLISAIDICNENLVVSAGYDGIVQVLDFQKGDQKYRIEASTQSLYKVKTIQNGDRFVVSGMGGFLKVYSAESG